MDSLIPGTIVDGILSVFCNVLTEASILKDNKMMSQFFDGKVYESDLLEIPTIDVSGAKFIKVPSDFAMGLPEIDEKHIDKFRSDGLSLYIIEQIKIQTPQRRANYELQLLNQIKKEELKRPGDDARINELINFYTPPFFSEVFIPESVVPKPVVKTVRGRKIFSIACLLPPLCTELDLLIAYIENCITILCENSGITATIESRIYYDYKILVEHFRIVFFIYHV